MKESITLKGSNNILKFLAFNRFIGKNNNIDSLDKTLPLNADALNISDNTLFSLFKNLHEHNLRFLVSGDIAAAFYGHIYHSTKVDLWLAPERENYEKLCILLNVDKENNSLITLAPIEALVGENFNLSIAFDLCYFKAYDFEGCHLLGEQAILNNTPVQILNLDHLIIEKMASGKAEEKTAIKELTRIQKLSLP